MGSTRPEETPNLRDYDDVRERFVWDDARRHLDGLPGGGLNICHEALDRHVAAGRGDTTAIRWLPRRGEPVEITYAELTDRAARFAGVLSQLGHGSGVTVATLAGRIPELYAAVLGTLRHGGVVTPLFSAFGPDPIAQRIELGSVEVLVTTRRLYERKVAPIRDRLPTLRHVLLTDGPGDGDGLVELAEAMSSAEPAPVAATGDSTPSLLHFTSGTTGLPKGALHVHEAVVAHAATGRFVLDLHPGDVYWCTADPGWVTGTSYGIVSPLVNGVTSVIDEADFDADRWYGIIADHRVDVWYTAPTALRMLMRIGADVASEYDLSSLRLVGSVGEPLNPEVVRWAQETYRVPVLDNWWQTETGAIMIANYRAEPVKPGSMGRPVPGIDATVLRRDGDDVVIGDDSEPVEVTEPDVAGELAVRRGWPSMFRTYLGNEERYRKSFAGSWYRSGDLAKRDADGYFWFVGRADDVVKTAGHLIGPFEVESVLIEHPAVTEAGIIGKPDETAGNILKAFVCLAADATDSEELRSDILAFARRRLGTVAAPREIDVVETLPKTRSGKIMRRLLTARELGLPEGDLSTLEGPS